MLERFLEDDVVVSVHLLTLLFDRSGLTLHLSGRADQNSRAPA
jgi:hypothetical protein